MHQKVKIFFEGSGSRSGCCYSALLVLISTKNQTILIGIVQAEQNVFRSVGCVFRAAQSIEGNQEVLPDTRFIIILPIFMVLEQA